MKLPRFVRTSTFRLALIYAAIFTVSSLLLLGVLYLRVTSYAYDQMRGSITAELESIAQEGRLEGFPAIQREVEERSQRAESSSSYYLLQSAQGERLAGNIQPIPRVAGDQELQVEPASAGRDRPASVSALLRAVILPDGALLAIGRDLADLLQLNRLITQSSLLAIASCVAVGLGGGVVLGFGFVQRLETIARTSQTIISGDLSQRIPIRQSGDELDRLSMTLNEMLDRIQALMETARQVSNDIAHDLRTPLSRLRRRLEKMADGAGDPQVGGQQIAAAITELDDILSTFTAILRIAEIEAQSRSSGFATVDLSARMRLLAETYLPVAEDAGQVLVVEIEDNVACFGDSDLLTQLLSNGIENAIRHCPPGATIRLSLHGQAGQSVAVIADDGPGIPVEERGKVFRRFYRLQRSRTTAGSGLGLALAAAVAEVHGARLTLSDAAPGTRFELILPASRPPQG